MMYIDELIDYTIKNGLIMIGLIIAEIIIQILLERCDHKEMEDL